MAAFGRLPTFPGNPIRIFAGPIRITDGSHFAFGGKVSGRPKADLVTAVPDCPL
jgi:hypothetical protein